MKGASAVNGTYLRTVWSVFRVAAAALFCFTVFVSVCYFFTGQGGPASGGLIITTPDDWYNGVRVSLAALLASAIGTVVYRRPYSRPMVVALAAGLVFLNLDPASVWRQVNSIASMPAPPGSAVMESISRLPDFDPEKWVQPSALDVVRRTRLYWVYYLGYMFWSVIVLYSGYIGQYLAGLAVFRGESRKESAAYLAENAGVGLLSSIVAGVVAMFLAGGLSYMAVGVLEGAAAAPRSRTREAMEAAERAQPRRPAVMARTNTVAEKVTSRAESPQRTWLGPASFARLRVYLLLVALAFFVTAYVAALSFKPRTSTWVACGAIVGVMAFPAAAARFLPDPQAPTAFFRLLEISPFALAGTGVAAALSGDWLAKTILARGSAQRRQQYKPL